MIKYYGHRWWDTSTLSEFFEQSLETYTATSPKEESIPLRQYQNQKELVFFSAGFTQSRLMLETQWTIDSIDLILGFIGGMAGVIWAILAFMLGSY